MKIYWSVEFLKPMGAHRKIRLRKYAYEFSTAYFAVFGVYSCLEQFLQIIPTNRENQRTDQIWCIIDCLV